MKTHEQLESFLREAFDAGRKTLLEDEAYAFLEILGIDIPKNYLLRKEKDINLYVNNKIDSEKLIMKIVSPDIHHKSDVGGIAVIPNMEEAIRSTYRTLIDKVKRRAENANIEGVLLCEWVDIEYELLLSVIRDDDFGYVLSTGLGGVNTEVFKDISMRLIPSNKNEYNKMVKELKSYKIFKGYRGSSPINLDRLVDAIESISNITEYFSKESESDFFINEIEMNPFVSTADGRLLPVDCLMSFSQKTENEVQMQKEPVTKNLEYFIEPKSVAIVGATDEEGKLGQLIMTNVLDGEIEEVIPINPKRDKIMELPAYKSVKDVPKDVDLVVIAVASKYSPQVVKDCVEKGVKAIIIVGGGFGEYSEEGQTLEDEVRQSIKGTDIRIIGPNCLGIYTSKGKLYTYAIPKDQFMFPDAAVHNVSLLTQSGALSIFLSELMMEVGFRAVVSYGNMLDVDMGDLVRFFDKDNSTDVIAIYAEGAKNGRKFFNAAMESEKPIIMIKGGRSKEGQKATISHTGSIAGDYDILRSAMKQSNCIESKNFEEFRDFITTFSFLNTKKVRSNRIAIISNAGGVGVLAADEIPNTCLELSRFEHSTREKIESYTGGLNKIGNPADLGVSVDDVSFVKSIEHLLDDVNVDAVVALPGLQPISLDLDRMFKNIIELTYKYDKPIVVGFSYTEKVKEHAERLERSRIPYFPTPERAIKSLSAFVYYHLNR